MTNACLNLRRVFLKEDESKWRTCDSSSDQWASGGGGGGGSFGSYQYKIDITEFYFNNKHALNIIHKCNFVWKVHGHETT